MLSDMEIDGFYVEDLDMRRRCGQRGGGSAQALDDAALSLRILWYKGGWSQPLAMRIVRATTHDIYHAGQIMYLRALQGIPPR